MNATSIGICAATELRLHDADGDDLILRWSSLDAETPLSQLRLPRAAYARVAAGWAGLLAEFAGRMFIDLARLLYFPAA